MSHSNTIAQPRLAGLSLAALGIVFGDIGTSPLYTLQTIITLAGGKPDTAGLLGLLSLIIWTLLVIAAVKYVSFVMRMDNQGEGGILALISLLGAKMRPRPALIAIGLFGAALIYGDGAITPPISVLSAIEGLKLATPGVQPYILPLSVCILILLFTFQSQGTVRIGWVFGPIMTVWFLAIGALGVKGILLHPAVLSAFNPVYGIDYLVNEKFTGFMVLGGVFLCVTGAEALYADMGHVGARPIRIAWYGLVLPALLLNYTGQTAWMLSGQAADDNIFFQLCPHALLIPMVMLATMATIIASQAIISGAFSMTRQAIHLGWCPPLKITQTSATGYGQIYVRAINWVLMVATVTLAITFGSSDRLAAAYGIAVSLTMLMTTLLLYVAMTEVWRWSKAGSLLIASVFVIIDAVFFSANLLKVEDGGWVPLVFAALIFTGMITWHRGIVAIGSVMDQFTQPVDLFMAKLHEKGVARVPGSGVFVTQTGHDMPPIIVWHVKQNKALQQHVLALWVVTEPVPYVPAGQQLELEQLAPDFWRATAHYGFMDQPDIATLLQEAVAQGCLLDTKDITYYVSFENVKHSIEVNQLPRWQESLFAFMRRNCYRPGDMLNLPRNQLLEIGRRIEI